MRMVISTKFRPLRSPTSFAIQTRQPQSSFAPNIKIAPIKLFGNLPIGASLISLIIEISRLSMIYFVA